jgi:hypothetical protein
MANLSAEAIRILRAATSGEDDSIIFVDFLDGSALDVGGQNLLEGANTRTIAMHRHAVRQLLEAGLIEDRAGKNEVFFVTGPGYEMAEVLGSG